MNCEKNIYCNRKAVKALLYMIACAGICISAAAWIAASEKYEYTGAAISGAAWLAITGLIVHADLNYKEWQEYIRFTDWLTAFLMTIFASLQILSWVLQPNLCVTGRLSTAPAVIVLCLTGTAAVIKQDYTAAKRLSALSVPVLAAGRFTFSILGGAPDITGWTVFEARCISELLVLVMIFTLCMMHSPEDGWNGMLTASIFMPLLTDVYDHNRYSLHRVRSAQTALCAASLAFMIYGGFYGGILMIDTIILVPLLMLISGGRNNHYLVTLPLILKTITDLGSSSFLHRQDLFIIYIVLDVLALSLAVYGLREYYSIVVMISVCMIASAMLLTACGTVDRSSPWFFREMAAYGAELTLYISFLLYGYGKSWSGSSLRTVMDWLLDVEEEHPDDDICTDPSAEDVNDVF